MSWDPRNGGPSPGAEAGATGGLQPDLAALVRECGAALLDALEAHRGGAREHAGATASYGFAAAVELGFGREHAEAIRETARLHEVGLVYVPSAVLSAAPQDRDPEGRSLVDAHSDYGAQLARGAGVPDLACEWIRAGGERFDGRGPAGLAGERVPIQARIIRTACACDAALTAPHPAEVAAAHRASALATLRAAAGRELDPRVVGALTAVLDRVSRG